MAQPIPYGPPQPQYMGTNPYGPPGAGNQPPYNPYPPMAYPQQPVIVQPVPQMGQQQPVQGQPLMVQGQAPLVMVSWGEHPQIVTCPHCRATVTTTVRKESGLFTWLIAGSLCVIGCWPCCLVPFCMDAAKDTVHVCPQCNAEIGTRKMMG
eukprot:TRINITY_DN32274_c0_g1_i1.p1 TRINITY_DN32274_c0_g1~~TRINITY_DN32274_c0_g1_i1.p1  ORF type:complete len:151 (+),score=5.53 TRINITY_DN32274_c0_g1_i1:133-585(+)